MDAWKQSLRDSSVALLCSYQVRLMTKLSGGDALTGNTRSHPEHDG